MSFTARLGSSHLAKRLRCAGRCHAQEFFLYASEEHRYRFGDHLTFTIQRKYEKSRDEVRTFAKMDFTARIAIFPMKNGLFCGVGCFFGVVEVVGSNPAAPIDFHQANDGLSDT